MVDGFENATSQKIIIWPHLSSVYLGINSVQLKIFIVTKAISFLTKKIDVRDIGFNHL